MIFYALDCEEIIGYSFNDKVLLRTCFTHTYYATEHGAESNEKLEYLGDSILNFVVAEYLFAKSSGDEGSLTKKRAELVSASPLGNTASRIGIDKYLLVGEGEKNKPAKLNMRADLFEAVIAGIYLDGGMEAARGVMERCWPGEEEVVRPMQDSKGQLQEELQKNGGETPTYRITGTSGPPHAPVFEAAVYRGGQVIGTGTGKTKKQAEQAAAVRALENLKAGKN